MDKQVEVLGGFADSSSVPPQCFRFSGQVNGRHHLVYVWRPSFDDAADAFAGAYPNAQEPDDIHQLVDGLWQEVGECQ